FFFSSRRRHTRSYGDWSSDVCSSDLDLATFEDRGTSGKAVRRRFCKRCGSPIVSLVEIMPDVHFIKGGTLDDRSWLRPTTHFWRSEERRVGKECRSRWSPVQ